jgi:D-glycero-alpha-D-manno-heptose-7-phosphate kinase
MKNSIRKLLNQEKVQASAPCRVDSGGTWDIKAMALPMQGIGPVTVNIAINLRTTVTLLPFEEGYVKINSEGFSKGEILPENKITFHSPFGLYFAAVSYFGFQGLEARIHSQAPVKSGLGGSSTALIALLMSLNKLSEKLGRNKLSKMDILHLGYHLEDGISGGNCGIQDQAAAVFGGVNQWKWSYGHRSNAFERISLLDGIGQKELSSHLLIAYSGESHFSSKTNRKWINDFLSGKTMEGWITANEIVNRLARAIHKRDWGKSAALLREEMAIRNKITPEALIPITKKLVKQAENEGCGARFAGAGSGGSLWAIGKKENIGNLRKVWDETLTSQMDAGILDCKVDPTGVK